MSMIMCKYGCLSDTDESPDFGFEEIKCEDGSKVFEYTCEPCLESEEDGGCHPDNDPSFLKS